MLYHPEHFTNLSFSFLFAAYLDPGLGYTFQGLGPILPAIAGAIAGTFALFWRQIKTLLSRLLHRSPPHPKTE